MTTALWQWSFLVLLWWGEFFAKFCQNSLKLRLQAPCKGGVGKIERVLTEFIAVTRRLTNND
ncbi:MAG: hypothetical protein KAY73_03980 [Giesbergeria sp.]|nr:hypothetical protein [Giesbergeria sp.]